MQMTKQEAIDELNNIKKYNYTLMPEEALDMAISALSNSQKQTESLIRTSTDSVSEADVIYRQQAIEELRDVIVKDVQFGDELTDGYNDGIDMAITVISKLPSAQRTGEWIQKPNIYGVAYCSECDYELHTNDTNYCPNCGADMKGETYDKSMSIPVCK